MINSSLFETSLGREIFYEYDKSKKGVPIVFLNGLSDSYSEWKKVAGLTQLDRPFLFVDLIGQGKSLDKEFASGKKYDYRITIEQQGHALLELCRHLKISEFSLAGFSYGGGLALWLAQNQPERVLDLILFLPFLLRLDLAFPLSRLLHFQYDMMKKMTPPFLHAPFHIVEKSYEHFVHDYMHFRFSSRIPQHMYREAAIQISEGIMNFNVFKILRDLPEGKLHLVSADLDTLIPKSLVREFWSRLPDSKKQSWTRLTDGEHLIFDQNPVVCASLLQSLLAMPPQDVPLERKITTQDLDLAEQNVFSA
jgi:pimeloyl-ACP methyl ester carboxylesterase